MFGRLGSILGAALARRAAAPQAGPAKRAVVKPDATPLSALDTIRAAWGGDASGSAPPPGLLLFGDSVFWRVSRTDADQRPLSRMLQDDLGRDAVVVAGSAFHPGLENQLLRHLEAMPAHPRTVLLPVNMRCFSPQWFLRPEYRFDAEIEAMARVPPGTAPAEPARPAASEAPSIPEAIRSTPVRLPGRPPSTYGAFLDLAAARPAAEDDKRARDAALMAFHYAVALEPDHPWLDALVSALRSARRSGIRPAVYVTPVNRAYGAELCGPAFDQTLAANVATLEARIGREIRDAGGVFADWSRDFEPGFFFHAQEKTEHLGAEGRLELGRRILGLLATVEQGAGERALSS